MELNSFRVILQILAPMLELESRLPALSLDAFLAEGALRL